MEFITENVPPAAMGLKDAIQFVKSSGMVPFEMLQPFLEWFSTNYNNEIRIYVQRSVGIRTVIKTPGFDEVIQEIINA